MNILTDLANLVQNVHSILPGKTDNHYSIVRTLKVVEDEILEKEVKDDNLDNLDRMLKSKKISTLKYLLEYISNQPKDQITGYGNRLTILCINIVFKSGDYYIHLNEDEYSGYQLIIAYAKSMDMSLWIANSADSELVEENLRGLNKDRVVDLNNTGSYWEGGVLNRHECYGYGKEYNDDNIMVFEGFLVGVRRVCYGKEYYGIREKNIKNNYGLIYEGGYWNGIHYGFGKLYDLNGRLEYDGEWKNDHPIDYYRIGSNSNNNDNDFLYKIGDDHLISLLIEEFVIGDTLFNDDNSFTRLHFSFLFIRLKKIEIGNKCFKNVREFVINGLERLEIVMIGKMCCKMPTECSSDGVFQITNCPNLRQLEIGNESFEDFHHFELSNVNSLQSIQLVIIVLDM